MKNRIILNICFYTFLTIIVFYTAFGLIDLFSFSKIDKKESENFIRIGYVNLNKDLISEKELIEFEKFDCDIWLFAEWNGNNLNNYKKFEQHYNKIYESIDTFTYGFYVLAKGELNMIGSEFDVSNRPYSCDYAKIMLETTKFNIAFVHAPPPVPTCNFETALYLNHLFDYCKKNNYLKNQFIIGDFNSIPAQDFYDKITKEGFIDAFDGNEWVNGTFGFNKNSPKMLRLDYMFYLGNIEQKFTSKFKLKSSDHCGLIADFEIK